MEGWSSPIVFDARSFVRSLKDTHPCMRRVTRHPSCSLVVFLAVGKVGAHIGTEVDGEILQRTVTVFFFCSLGDYRSCRHMFSSLCSLLPLLPFSFCLATHHGGAGMERFGRSTCFSANAPRIVPYSSHTPENVDSTFHCAEFTCVFKMAGRLPYPRTFFLGQACPARKQIKELRA